jgi:hypothetical protein
MAAYFRGGPPPASTEEMADYYQKLDMFGVLFAIDAETATGRPPIPNDYFADCVRRWPKTFTAFGNVDPWKGKAAVREAEARERPGLKGSSSTRRRSSSIRTTSASTRSGRRRRSWGSSCCSTPARRAWGGRRAAAVKLGYARRSRTWTTSPPTFRR